MAQDEWRVEVELDDPEHGFSISERLRAADLDQEVAERLGDRVIVTRDGSRLYVYTQTDVAAREAERVVRGIVDEERLTADISCSRWEPGSRDWQDAEASSPASAGAGRRGDDEEADEGVQHPLFVFIEHHEPRFMRDLGL